MPTINADIRDSLGVPLVGYILIDLDYELGNATTNYLSVPAKVPLVNGLATFILEPSEVARVSYGFSIYKTIANQPDELVREKFHATIPASNTPINFVDLAPTGITQAAMDGSLSAISRRLVADDVFWARFQDELLQLKGAYSASAWYQRGNMVFYQGGTYVFISRLAATGIAPTAGQMSSYWMPTAMPGQTVIGALNPAEVAAKADKTYVDTQDGLKANRDGATLTNAVSGDNLPLNANASQIVYASWVKQVLAPVQSLTVPIGSVSAFAGSSAPAGWVFCDGRVLDRTTYAALFAILGLQYAIGGETASQFRVPDLRGRMIACVDQFSAGVAANRIPSLALAGSGGSSSKTLSVTEIPSHGHSITDPGHTHSYQAVASGGAVLTGGSGNTIQSINTGANTTGITVNNTGGGQSFSLMNPHMGLVYIICHGVV